MSVELDAKNKSGGFRAECDNICRLYHLQLIQKKVYPFGILVFLCLSLAIISIFSQTSLIFFNEDVDYIRGTGNTIWIYLLVFVLYIACSDYNILSAENLSIYPGTVRTRFISRLLFDYTIFFASITCCILCRILGAGITNFIIMLTGNDGIQAFFDLKSLLLRAIACLCYILLIHGFYVLFFVAATKIGMKNTAISLVLLGTLSLFFLKFTPLYEWIKSFAMFYVYEDLGLANVVLRTLLTTALLLIISFAIMSTIHAWKDHNQKELLAISILYSYILLMAITIGGSILLEKQSYSCAFPEEGLENMIQNKELISHDYKIQAGVSDGGLLEQSCTENDDDFTTIAGMDANIAWMNLDKAAKLGMVPKNTSLAEGEMLVRIVASDYKYKGINLYENFINGINFNISNSKCTLKIDKNIIIYDDFLSAVDAILGNDIDKIGDFGDKYFTIESCQIYVIFNKGDIIKPKKLDTMYGCYNQ